MYGKYMFVAYLMPNLPIFFWRGEDTHIHLSILLSFFYIIIMVIFGWELILESDLIPNAYDFFFHELLARIRFMKVNYVQDRIISLFFFLACIGWNRPVGLG